MTRLFTTAGGSVVDKILDVHHTSETNSTLSENSERLSSMPKELDENTVVAERALIEACASSKKPYLFSKGWNQEVKDQLSEYAAICGCKTIAVDPEDETVKAFSKPSLQKEASVNTTVAASPASPVLNIGDVFKLDTKGDTSHLNPAKWEQLTAETKTSKPDVVAHRAGAILPIGGGEVYQVSPHHRIKPGQNSVTAPDAIGQLLKDKGEDIGTSLKRQNIEREAVKKAAIQKAEAEVAGKMRDDKDYSAYSGRKVHMTESLTAQPGIRDSSIQMGAFQKELKAMPDRTQGEQLKSQADQRKAGIQRQAGTAKQDFTVTGSSKHSLSDIFTQPEKWMPKQAAANTVLRQTPQELEAELQRMTKDYESQGLKLVVVKKDPAGKWFTFTTAPATSAAPQAQVAPAQTATASSIAAVKKA